MVAACAVSRARPVAAALIPTLSRAVVRRVIDIAADGPQCPRGQPAVDVVFTVVGALAACRLRA